MTPDPTVAARFTLFGHAPSPATVDLEPRPLAWRLRRSLTVLGLALVAAPAVFVIPPHVPWALGVIAAGVFFARLRWSERFTIRRLEGECPRCGNPIGSMEEERLRVPHTVSCDACHHLCTLVL
jgi:hypothetical protein